METAEKMMLVPATRPDASIIKMSELDKAMSQVLKNPTLSSSDKMRLYQQILMRNLEIENKIKNDQITKSDNNIKIDNNKDLIKFDSLPVKKELYDDWMMSNTKRYLKLSMTTLLIKRLEKHRVNHLFYLQIL